MIRVLSRNPRVVELAEAIRETQPVTHDADEGTVWRLALCYYRIERASVALDEADAAAPVASAVYADKHLWLGRLRADLATWLRLAASIEEQLGRTPASRGKLGVHVSQARRNLSLIEHYSDEAA